MKKLYKLLHIDIEKRGELYLLASRPDIGKSILSSNIAQELYNIGEDVAIISLESMILKTSIGYSSLQKDSINIEQLQHLLIDLKAKNEKFSFCIIDHIQHLKYDKRDELCAIIKKLKSLSCDLNINILINSQFPIIYQTDKSCILKYIYNLMVLYRHKSDAYVQIIKGSSIVYRGFI